MRQAKLFHRIACGLVVGAALLGLGCDEEAGKRELIITDPVVAPLTTKTLCEKDDRTGVQDGIQINITVSAPGFDDGDTVLLSVDGAKPAAGDGQIVRNEVVTFMNYGIPQGLHSIQAVSTDGDIKSDAIQFKVDATEPTLDFVGLSTTKPLGKNDDLDLATAKILDVDIEVLTSLSNGDMVELFLSAPDAATGISQGKQTITNRRAIFPRVKFDKSGKWKLEVRTVDACMNGTATLEVQAVVEEALSCEITFSKAPLVRSGISALVFNAALDGSNAALFQTTATVTTEVGNTVDLFQNGSTQGTKVAASDGAGKGKVTYDLSLSEQSHSLTANCTGPGGFTQPAKEVSLFVDITSPTCAFTAPKDKDTLSPVDDVDKTDEDVDFAVALTVTGKDGDAESTAVEVFLTVGQNPESAALKTSVASGKAQVIAAVGVDADVAIRATTEDAAGNPCIPTPISVNVDVNGCNLLLKAPLTTITADADADMPGLQTDITVESDADCAGREVTLSDCDTTGTVKVNATSASPPTATFTKVTLCADSACEVQKTCKVEVTHPDGFTTSVTPGFKVDTLKPGTPVVVGKQLNRNAARGEFAEPADNATNAIKSCDLKVSKTAITEENYAALDIVQTFAGTTPGTSHFVDFTNQRPGNVNPFFFAVQCVDSEGNKSPVGLAKEFVLHLSGDTTRSAPRVVPGEAPDDNINFGTSMTSADLDKNGFLDLVVGGPLVGLTASTQKQGAIFIFMGSSAGISAAPDWVILGSDTDNKVELGRAVTRIDWNDDGTDDIAIGGSSAGVVEGKVLIYFGEAGAGSKWKATQSTTVINDFDTGTFATNVVVTPDRTDVFFDPGQTWDDPTPVFKKPQIAFSLATLDFDGDKRQDLLISTQGRDKLKGGAVVLFGGSSETAITIPSKMGTAKAIGFSFSDIVSVDQFNNGAGYGTRLANLGRLGDVTDDQRDDIIIASNPVSFVNTDPLLAEARAFVFYGEAQPSTSFKVIVSAEAPEMWVAETEALEKDKAGADVAVRDFGADMGSIADQNGDGKREIVICAPGVGANVGRVYVVPGGIAQVGQRKDVGTAALFTITGNTDGDRFGAAIANPRSGFGGDVDGDGVEDLVLLANLDLTIAPGTNRTFIYVWYGGIARSGALLALSRNDDFQGPPQSHGGNNLFWVGDLTMDQRNDLVWTMDGFENATSGSLQVVF
jgi:hypothetical protein